jgi:HPr kinase/phosphorylase
LNETKNNQISLSVERFFKENKKRLKLKCITGQESLQRSIFEKELHRPGLALAGFVECFSFRRIQICGNTEAAYLKKLSLKQQENSLRRVFPFEIPCFLFTHHNEPTEIFIRLSGEFGIPVFGTPFTTTKVTQLLGDYLDEQFAPRTYVHGSLVDVYGIGVLITGRSGIGKSEVALDLVARGHRLVVDDVVTIVRRTEGILLGLGNETLRYNMEIRGVGLIDIQSVFGIRSIRRQKRIEVMVELIDWDKLEKYERLGLKEVTEKVLGEKMPLIRLPIYPGKNISVIVEVIALNQLLKIYGHHSAKKFTERLTRTLQSKLQSMKEYLDHDFE